MRVDFLVIGSGISGLSYALEAAEAGKVAAVTKDVAYEGSTHYAQGGISAVISFDDTVEEHIRDTQVAGDFLCDDAAVEVVCREGRDAVDQLIRFGAEFTRDEAGELHLAREGGHSKHRIVHAADMTGKEIERALLESARAHPNVTFYEHHAATTSSPPRRTNPIGPPFDAWAHRLYVDRTAPSSVSSPARCSSPRAAPVSSFRAQPTRA